MRYFLQSDKISFFKFAFQEQYLKRDKLDTKKAPEF